MNPAESMSLRARINNFSKQHGISPQLVLQSFFAERFLARIAQSPYVGNLAIKGGTLMSAILGIERRTTMDVDATIIGIRADEARIVAIIETIAAIDIGDGIVFTRDESMPTAIVKDDEYGGYTIGLVARFGTIRLPIGVDVTFGDAITPNAESRDFRSLLDDAVSARLLAYPVETVMAEKLQTILKRGVATTRPRDFYDLHMLHARREYDMDILAQAVKTTFARRKSEESLVNWHTTINAFKTSVFQRDQWRRYTLKMPFAKDLAFDAVIVSIEDVLAAL
ncbi:MAG: nucleotidyl transferase AbiEii/AbiGii toxin family protein [Kiritimatiellia bacterium]